MTKFLDGPAAGQTLMLHRSPFLMRVVKGKDGKIDALDQWEDSPRKDEEVFVYEMAELKGHCHINAGMGRSGFYTMADYKLCAEQPPQSRDNTLWTQWCELQCESGELGKRWNEMKARQK